MKKKTKAQNILLLFVSYFFYGYVDLMMLPLLITTTVVFYLIGIGISHFNNIGSKNKASLLTTIGIGLGIGLLLFFKYLNFFIVSFSKMVESLGFQSNASSLNIIIPIGISFYTFRLISYLIEIKRGVIDPSYNIITFGAYVAFFPCLLSGPIDRPQKFIPQLEKKRSFNYAMAADGSRQVLWGMFKKMVVADNIAVSVNYIWAEYTNLPGSTLLLGVFFFAFQLYADFSGYSDMAIGIAKILGFNVAKNFKYPYFARDIAEFWRHWHISLTSWLTDYIYIPLGGNRKGKVRQFINIMIVFSLCGLWHGAGWTFLLWGIYNGLLFLPLILKKKEKRTENVAKGRILPYFRDILQIAGTFLFVNLGWVIVRAENLRQVIDYLTHLFNTPIFTIPSHVNISVIYILLLVILEWNQRDREFPLQIKKLQQYPLLKWGLYYVFVFTILLFAGKQSQFIYFQF